MNKLWKVSKKIFAGVTGLCLFMFFAAVIVSYLGTLMAGGIEHWQKLLKNAAPYLLIWRILVYSVIGSFWYATYKKHKTNDNQQGIERLSRLGWLALLVVVFVEGTRVLGGS